MTSHTAPPLPSETADIPNLLKLVSRHLKITPPRGAAYDDRQIVVICMTPRSGSGYLGSVLEANGLGLTKEHFRIQGGALGEYAAKLSKQTHEAWLRKKIETLTSPRGTFCVKCDWAQYAPLYATGLHAHYMRNATFFYLTRQDVLGQAISRYIATQRNLFHTPDGEGETPVQNVAFSYPDIRTHLERIIRMQSDWERFFASEGIVPHRIAYEDLASSPGKIVRELGEVLGITLEDPQVETTYKVTRTDRNEEMRAAYIRQHRNRLAALSAKG